MHDEVMQNVRRFMEQLVASVPVEHWLGSVWPSWRPGHVRRYRDGDRGVWYWVVPDFERGRSRVVGIQEDLLVERSLEEIRRVLESGRWQDRIDDEPLLLVRGEGEEMGVGTWEPDLEKEWFRDPRGGWFVAYGKSAGPSRSPAQHMTLLGETWSARGPEDPAPPSRYSRRQLLPFLPTAVRDEEG